MIKFAPLPWGSIWHFSTCTVRRLDDQILLPNHNSSNEQILSKNRVKLTLSPRQSFLLVDSVRLEGKCRLARILLTMVWPSNGYGLRSGELCPSHPPGGHTTRRRWTQSTFQPQVWSLTQFYSAYVFTNWQYPSTMQGDDLQGPHDCVLVTWKFQKQSTTR